MAVNNHIILNTFISINIYHYIQISSESTKQMDTGIIILECTDPQQQESLQAEVIPDPMEGEQTWPTEEELAEAEGNMLLYVEIV